MTNFGKYPWYHLTSLLISSHFIYLVNQKFRRKHVSKLFSAFPESVAIDRSKDVVIIPNTSGSTGMPKGAMHTHHNLIANNASMRY
jgi:long-subunit acyl-CoA synthetase (AMP-forming)